MPSSVAGGAPIISNLGINVALNTKIISNARNTPAFNWITPDNRKASYLDGVDASVDRGPQYGWYTDQY